MTISAQLGRSKPFLTNLRKQIRPIINPDKNPGTSKFKTS